MPDSAASTSVGRFINNIIQVSAGNDHAFQHLAPFVMEKLERYSTPAIANEIGHPYLTKPSHMLHQFLSKIFCLYALEDDAFRKSYSGGLVV